MKTLQEFINSGVYRINDMGEQVKVRVDSRHISIPFSNGWKASIHIEEGKYNVAVCDHNGYFDWNILKPFGLDNGTIDCNSEEELCKALTIIEALK